MFLWGMWCISKEYVNVTFRIEMVGHPQMTLPSTFLTTLDLTGCSRFWGWHIYTVHKLFSVKIELFSYLFRWASCPFCCVSSEKFHTPTCSVAVYFDLSWRWQPGRHQGYSCTPSEPSSQLCDDRRRQVLLSAWLFAAMTKLVSGSY